MAKPDQIKDASLRADCLAARQQMRAGDHSEAVRRCAAAFERFLAEHRELLKQPAGAGNRLAPMMWPRLGANLSVVDGVPHIEWHRERFSLSEAATYYEFTVDAIVANQDVHEG